MIEPLNAHGLLEQLKLFGDRFGWDAEIFTYDVNTNQLSTINMVGLKGDQLGKQPAIIIATSLFQGEIDE